MFWDKFEKIVCQIVPEIERLSEMIEIQKLSEKIVPESERVSKMIEMLKLSDDVHEKIIRQIDPESNDDQVDFIFCEYPQISSFYYPLWRDCVRKEYESGNIEEIDDTEDIDKAYEEVAKNAISSPNTFEIVVAAERDLIGRVGDVDLTYYYSKKYFKSYKHAIEMWYEKIDSDRLAFEKTLKAWVGLFVSDESVSEHYYQIISYVLSSYYISDKKPKRAIR